MGQVKHPCSMELIKNMDYIWVAHGANRGSHMLSVTCAAKAVSAVMKDTIYRWSTTHMLSMFAKLKQTTDKEVDDTLKAQLTQQMDALTSEWSEENQEGQSAILTLTDCIISLAQFVVGLWATNL